MRDANPRASVPPHPRSQRRPARCQRSADRCQCPANQAFRPGEPILAQSCGGQLAGEKRTDILRIVRTLHLRGAGQRCRLEIEMPAPASFSLSFWYLRIGNLCPGGSGSSI